MHEASVQLFEAYQEKHGGSINRALAETIQAIALLGLARTDFFSHAAFYGGTALRLLYNLDRFSEDLDFSLLKCTKEFQLSTYLGALRNEMEAFGFSVDIEKHQKKFDTPIESAFIKANTRIHVIRAGIPRAIADRIHRNALCKVVGGRRSEVGGWMLDVGGRRLEVRSRGSDVRSWGSDVRGRFWDVE